MVIESCDISQNDIELWWKKFLDLQLGGNSNETPQAMTDKDAIFLYGIDERISPAGTLRGNVSLKANSKQRVIGPVINTLAEEQVYAEFETANAAKAYALVRRNGYLGGIEHVSWKTIYTDLGQDFKKMAPDGYSYSGGAWFCISANDLETGDRIEFGAEGTRGFKTEAVWVVNMT